MDDMENIEITRRMILEKIASSDDDLVLIAEVSDTLQDEVMALLMLTVDGDEEKRRFFHAGGFWRPFVHSTGGKKWLAVLRIHGRCLNRYVQEDGYCPDCNFKHKLHVEDKRSVLKKRTLEENLAWWREHNPYMLDKAPTVNKDSAEKPYRIIGDIADYTEKEDK